MAEGHDCPVCASTAPLFDVVDFNKSCEEARGKFLPLSGTPVYYALCRQCGLLFAPEFQDWTKGQFLEHIYNDDYLEVDPDYASGRPINSARMLGDLFGASKGRIRHLDYGGGDGHLSRLLTADGWTSTSYDPFFEPGATLGGETFDLITAVEVFEHAPHPHQMMEQLLSAAHDQTFILFTTLVHDNSVRPNERLSWWYASPRNGHVSVYSRRALAQLGQRYGLLHGSFDDNMHCFFKTVPDWAQHLVSVQG